MNDERDLVIQRLSEHFAADRITLDELERRMELAYQARSPGDLMALTADLPTAHQLPAVHTERHLAPQRIRTALGNVVRSGNMVVPARLDIRAVLGNIELDLRAASFGPQTVISISAILGNVEIVLPDGVRVESDGTGLLGSFESHILPGAQPMVGTAPTVRLTGQAVLGNVEISSAPRIVEGG